MKKTLATLGLGLSLLTNPLSAQENKSEYTDFRIVNDSIFTTLHPSFTKQVEKLNIKTTEAFEVSKLTIYILENEIKNIQESGKANHDKIKELMNVYVRSINELSNIELETKNHDYFPKIFILEMFKVDEELKKLQKTIITLKEERNNLISK